MEYKNKIRNYFFSLILLTDSPITNIEVKIGNRLFSETPPKIIIIILILATIRKKIGNNFFLSIK